MIEESIKHIEDRIKFSDLRPEIVIKKESAEAVLSELETYKKIAEKLAEELSKYKWLNDKDAILKIYREKVEEDETYS